MKFSLPNEKTENYLENFKPFQASVVAVSAGGFQSGFSEAFLALLDGGAKNTCISSGRMKRIMQRVRGKDGKPLQSVGKIKVKGVIGKEQDALIYIIPHFYLGNIHFEDLAVTVINTNNFDCLIGRSVLHQCISTYDPLTDMMHFDFDPRLQQNKQTVLGRATFGKVHLFTQSDAKFVPEID